MHSECIREFIAEFHREMNRLAAAHENSRENTSCDLAKVERDIARIIQAIKDGIPALSLKDELCALESRKDDLERALQSAPSPVVRLHPNLAEFYREKVANLADALNAEELRHDASETIRTLIDEVRLTPNDAQLEIELFGELGALLNLANENPRSQETGAQAN